MFEGGSCDWARFLEKSIATQMVAIKEKGQKLYTCAPIWQELYQKATKKSIEKRPWEPEKQKEVKQPKKKTKMPVASS